MGKFQGVKFMNKFVLPAALASAVAASAASITVNPASTKQEVLGFGGGSVYYQNWIEQLSAADQKNLFDTAFYGLNLSLLRIGNWLQDDSKASTVDMDAIIVKAAKERRGNNLKVEMSSWSAPANLKKSNSVNGNAASENEGTLKSSNSDQYGKYVYTEFANWWKTSLQTYATKGITPDYISFQNEPDMFASYEETLFEPSETNQKAGYAQALNAVSDAFKTLPNAPKIIGPEPLGIGYNSFQKYMADLDDSKLSGYAYHLYNAGSGNDNSGNNYLNPENFREPMSAIATSVSGKNKPIIMTEFCPMENEPREVDMVGLAHIMQVGFTDGNLNGYIAWELFYGYHSQFIGVCPGAGWDLDGQGKYVCEGKEIKIFPEYHAMRHYSKFVNPGWKVVSASTAEANLKTVAFTNATADSVTVIAINTGKSAITLENAAPNGYSLDMAVQSKENGAKSKTITAASCTILPARSITTLVFRKGVPAPAATTCKDETTDPDYNEPVIVPADDIVIVDYSKTTDVSTWAAMHDDLTPVTHMTTALDGVTGYASVPLAGCEQGSEDEGLCGYRNQLFNISTEGAAALKNCSKLVITMRSMDSENAYVNVGGAAGSSWVDYEYGKTASASKWSETAVKLDKEGGNGSTALTFNSNASGIYIAKIVATGCTTKSGIQPSFNFQVNDSHMAAKLFDLNGNLIWSGIKTQALGANGELLLNVPQGTYLLKTNAKTVKAIKK